MAKEKLTEKAKGVLLDVKNYLEENTEKEGVFTQDVLKESETFNSKCASLSALAQKGFFKKEKRAKGEKMLTCFIPEKMFFDYFAENNEEE